MRFLAHRCHTPNFRCTGHSGIFFRCTCYWGGNFFDALVTQGEVFRCTDHSATNVSMHYVSGSALTLAVLSQSHPLWKQSQMIKDQQGSYHWNFLRFPIWVRCTGCGRVNWSFLWKKCCIKHKLNFPIKNQSCKNHTIRFDALSHHQCIDFYVGFKKFFDGIKPVEQIFHSKFVLSIAKVFHGGSLTAMAAPFKLKAEERANISTATAGGEPPAKRACSIFEKKLQKLPSGDLSFVRDRWV